MLYHGETLFIGWDYFLLITILITTVKWTLRMSLPPTACREQDRAGTEGKLRLKQFVFLASSVGTDLFLTDKSYVVSGIFMGKQ